MYLVGSSLVKHYRDQRASQSPISAAVAPISSQSPMSAPMISSMTILHKAYAGSCTLLENTAANVGTEAGPYLALKAQQMVHLKILMTKSMIGGSGMERQHDAGILQRMLQQASTVFSAADRQHLSACLAQAMADAPLGDSPGSRKPLQSNLHIWNYGTADLQKKLDADDTPWDVLLHSTSKLLGGMGCKNPCEHTMASVIAWIFASSIGRQATFSADLAYAKLQELKTWIHRIQKDESMPSLPVITYPESAQDFIALHPTIFDPSDQPIGLSQSSVTVREIKHFLHLVPRRRSNKLMAASQPPSSSGSGQIVPSTGGGHRQMPWTEGSGQQFFSMLAAGLQAMQQGTIVPGRRRSTGMQWTDLRNGSEAGLRNGSEAGSEAGDSPPANEDGSPSWSRLGEAAIMPRLPITSPPAADTDDRLTLETMLRETDEAYLSRKRKATPKTKAKAKAKATPMSTAKAVAVPKPKAKAVAVPKPKAKAVAVSKPKAMAAVPKPKAKAVAVSTPKAKAGLPPSPVPKAKARLILGCAKCRGQPTGCAQCWNPNFSGSRGPR